jgi:hypothetical protein
VSQPDIGPVRSGFDDAVVLGCADARWSHTVAGPLMPTPAQPQGSERRQILALIASGQPIDPAGHGDTLAILIGEACVTLEDPSRNVTFSLTDKGLAEMARR